MNVEMWPADRPIPYEQNARHISDDGLAKIAASLREFGWRQPIVVDRHGVVVVGHMRLRAAKLLGMAEVPVHVAENLTEAQIASYRLADNRTGEEATWVQHLLVDELQLLKGLDFDLSLTGFGADEINRMMISDDVRERAEETPEPPAIATAAHGDVWLLGQHRLACGDCTDPEVVARLLNGAQPHLMVTDPPYGVEYDASWRNKVIREDGPVVGARAVGKVLNDDRADWRDAWRLAPCTVAYVWHAGVHAQSVAESMVAVGYKPRAQIVWVKPRFAIGRGNYHWQHEPCLYADKGQGDHWNEEGASRFAEDHELALYAVKGGARGEWRGGRKQSTVWSIEHRKSETGHSTQKPIECMQRPIENNSRPGDAVYEPFSGSGTTIMAGELAGRIVLACELNPAYVDVACMRYRNAFQSEPILEATGQTFSQVKLERAAPEAVAA